MNTVQSTLKIEDTLSEIELSLRNPISRHKVWIFVEGEDDIRIYPKFFIAANVIFKTTNGSSYKLPAVTTKASQITSQVIGIKDADFDKLEQKASVPNLFRTDTHDIETMMISHDSVLRNVFTEYSVASNSEMVRKEILKQASYLGYIRWFNHCHDLEILFKGLGINLFYDGSSEFKKEECLQSLNDRSPNKKRCLCAQDISDFMQSKPLEEHELLDLCNGHDVCKMFVAHLFRNDKTKYSDKDFEKSLRLSYGVEEFNTSLLCRDLRMWSSNAGFDILKT